VTSSVSVTATATPLGTAAPLPLRGRQWPLAPFLYLAPMIVLLAVFTYWPLLHTIYLSFVQWNMNPDQPMRWVGAANYSGIFNSPLFDAAFRNTLIYIVASIPLKVLLPIPIAIFVWTLATRGQVYRALLFLPTLFSFTVVAVVFLWLLNPIGGHFVQVARLLGGQWPNVLTDPDLAIWTILLISTWKVIGFNTLLYVAGLASINRDYVEAMRLDGASDWSLVRHLLWPLLTPTTLFVLISTVIFAIQQVFTPIDIMTEGGPQNGTTNLFYMVYQYAFRTFNVGFGAAGTVIIFAFLLAITLIKMRTLDRHVQYQQ
jgi:multiple sugar transport system permease protein/sn-glycerol 3-phosphate transport system permease protein